MWTAEWSVEVEHVLLSWGYELHFSGQASPRSSQSPSTCFPSELLTYP